MTAPIRCLIVDDEPLSRGAIRDLAAQDPDLQIIGEACDVEEAVAAIARHRPDLLFLDIQMPEASGFQVLEMLQERGLRSPVTIFVTAYDQYALQAFEARALDYLLKPIDGQRFLKAVSAAKSRVTADSAWQTANKLADLVASNPLLRRRSGRVPVRSADGRIFFVALDDVEWIEASGNYINLHTRGGTHTLRETITSFEDRFHSSQFIRIHRSAIVNSDHVQEVQPWFTGEYVVRLKSGKELTLSRGYLRNLPLLLEQGP